MGLTVMLNKPGVPEHPLAVGVTLTAAAMAVTPVLDNVKEGMLLPFPEPASPIEVLLFAQLKEVPDIDPEKLSVPEAEPVQAERAEGTVTVGLSFTTRFWLALVVPHSLVASSVTE